jgi:biopolymer transport protein ExbD
VKPHRKWIGADGMGTDLGIIITPMLDMAFQLLAFFIMTYHPPAREAVVDDTLLPAAVAKKKMGAGPPDGSSGKKDPEIRSALVVTVRAVPRDRAKGEVLEPGQPKEIYVTRPFQPEPDRPSFSVAIRQRGAKPGDPPADFDAALDRVVKELAKYRESPLERDLPLEISADRALKFQYVARLRDKVAPLGFKRIGFNEPP